jgi:NADH:ubiquinone oxidoreductase subunit E
MGEKPVSTVCDFSDINLSEKISEVVDKYKGTDGCLIQVLHEAQDIFGYLPLEVQQCISKKLGLSLSTVSGVISFYSFFSITPKAEHSIKICLGTACYVRGGEKIVEAIEKELGVKVGDNTPDNKFSFQLTRCLGACGLAPVIMIDEDVHQRVSASDVKDILAKY